MFLEEVLLLEMQTFVLFSVSCCSDMAPVFWLSEVSQRESASLITFEQPRKSSQHPESYFTRTVGLH